MHIKVATSRTKDKTYRYVRIAQGDECKIVCTLGLLEDVIASRETLIKGLTALSLQDDTKTTGQTSRAHRRRHGPGQATPAHRTKKGHRGARRQKSQSSAIRIYPIEIHGDKIITSGQHRTKITAGRKVATFGRKSKTQDKNRRKE